MSTQQAYIYLGLYQPVSNMQFDWCVAGQLIVILLLSAAAHNTAL